MTVEKTELKKSTRISAICVIVSLSVVLPAAVVFWCLVHFLSVKPIGAISKHYSAYRAGCMKNGEFWYPILQFYNGVDPLMSTMRVHRLDLKTGIDRETEFELDGYLLGWGKLNWIGDNLCYSYVTTVKRNPQDKTRICLQFDSKLVDLDLSRFDSSSILGTPFEYEGRLSVVEQTPQGRSRLVQWIDGKWSDGLEILLPSSDRLWVDDPQRNRKVLLPMSSVRSPPSTSRGNMELNVVPHGGEAVLFLMDESSKFFAFRHGFEFANELPIASALAPANAEHDVSGWMQTAMLVGRDCHVTIHAGHEQLYLSLWAGWSRFGGHNKQQIRAYTSDGQCEPLIEDPDEVVSGMGLRQSQIATSPSESTSYLLQFNSWNSLSIRRIEGRSIRPSSIVKHGNENEYLTHWLSLTGGLLFAWILHIVILVTGTSWLLERQCPAYRFGMQNVTLASPLRRSFAFAFDGLIAIATLGLCCRLLCGSAISEFHLPSTVRACETLYFVFEQHLPPDGDRLRTAIAVSGHLKFQFNRLCQWIEWNPEFLVVLAPCSLCLFVMKSYWEGRYETTPGKWLFGIRTVRTTLRRGSFARSLVRNAMFWCDLPLLMTPLPAVVSMAFSDNRQRLGDRVADTIVVRNNR